MAFIRKLQELLCSMFHENMAYQTIVKDHQKAKIGETTNTYHSKIKLIILRQGAFNIVCRRGPQSCAKSCAKRTMNLTFVFRDNSIIEHIANPSLLERGNVQINPPLALTIT